MDKQLLTRKRLGWMAPESWVAGTEELGRQSQVQSQVPSICQTSEASQTLESQVPGTWGASDTGQTEFNTKG